MRRRGFSLLLLFAFLLGSFGHILSRADAVTEVPYTLTLQAERANALLLSSLPKEGDTVRLLDREGRLLSITSSSATLYEMGKEGVSFYSSLLFSTVTLRVETDAHTRAGRFYLGDRYLALGDEITLRASNFSMRARFIAYSADF